MPYIQKYVRGANEKGLVGLVVDTLSQATLGQKMGMIVKGGKGIISRDIIQALTLLIDIELLPFKGRPLGVIFLHDTLTDLALGLKMPNLLEVFREHVEKNYMVPAGFATKNLSLLKLTTQSLGWNDLVAMASFNSLGFYVNPSLERMGAELMDPQLTVVAMNSLASGRIKPNEAYSFLATFPAIKSIVVGVSRQETASETINSIYKHMLFAAAA